MRTKKSIYNLVGDTIPQIVISLLGFLRIKIFLNAIGTEQLGVYQLFGQILSYLALAELGLTSAVMYFLYKPIHDKKYKKISAIISGAKKSFTLVMIIMTVIGVLISPFVRFLISDTNLSNLFIIIAFILTILVNILSYFSTPYILLFDASQEKYKYILYNQSILAIRYVIEMIVIYFTKNLFIALLIEILFTMIQNFVVKKLFTKNYPNVSVDEKPDYCFWSKTKDLIPHKIGSLVSTNIDVLILSKCLGLTYVVIYNCYYYITNTFSNILSKIGSATLASVGDLIVSEPKKAYKTFLEYNSFLFFVATILCVPLFACLTPFVNLWYGKNMIVNDITSLLFVSLLFYGIIRICLNTFCTAAGVFRETLICVYLEIIINLVISLLLVSKFKIMGLLIGTILSLILSEFFIKPFILNKKIFNNSIKKYYLDCLKYIIIVIINILVIFKISKIILFNNIFIWLIFGIFSFIFNLLVTYLYYKIMKKTEFIERIIFMRKKNEKS